MGEFVGKPQAKPFPNVAIIRGGEVWHCQRRMTRPSMTNYMLAEVTGSLGRKYSIRNGIPTVDEIPTALCVFREDLEMNVNKGARVPAGNRIAIEDEGAYATVSAGARGDGISSHCGWLEVRDATVSIGSWVHNPLCTSNPSGLGFREMQQESERAEYDS